MKTKTIRLKGGKYDGHTEPEPYYMGWRMKMPDRSFYVLTDETDDELVFEPELHDDR